MIGTQSLADELWQDSQTEILQALHHPFIRQLGDGSLPRDAFQFYIAQDAHFLAAFFGAYQSALKKAAKAGDWNAEEVLKSLLHGVSKELELHTSYAKEWGVDLPSELIPSSATKAYTDFLHAVATKEDVPHILAAMTPCSKLYAYLGRQLAKAYPDAMHAYKDWIATYSSDSFHALPAAKEVLLNRMGKRADFGELRNQ